MNYQAEFITLRAERRTARKQLRELEQQLRAYKKDPMRINSLIIETEGEIQGTKGLIKKQDDEIRQMRDTVKSLTKNMDNLELQIFYSKYMKGESLKVISKRLKYSYSHVKRISAKIRQKVDVQKQKR